MEKEKQPQRNTYENHAIKDLSGGKTIMKKYDN